MIAAPGKPDVIPLPPEFVQPQDGQEKQDCGLAAAKRWPVAWGNHYSSWNITLPGDDLYCHRPFCGDAAGHGYHVLPVCKPDSHPVLYGWIAEFGRTGAIRTIGRTRRDGRQRLTERYRYMNQVPLRDSDGALMLNRCEITVTNAKGKVTCKNAWATTHPITGGNVADTATAGRARRKAENGNNNVLENHGCHFEHDFGHGEKHLSNFPATLILLA